MRAIAFVAGTAFLIGPTRASDDPGPAPEHPALGGFVIDPDYLNSTFFPQALNEVMPSEERTDTSHPEPAIMVRAYRDQSPFAASACWDGGKPEVERPFDGVFQGLILGIGFHGTTIADMSRRFARRQLRRRHHSGPNVQFQSPRRHFGRSG